MRMLGGDSTGEATGSVAADRVRNALKEAACPAEEALQLAWRHWEDGW